MERVKHTPFNTLPDSGSDGQYNPLPLLSFAFLATILDIRSKGHGCLLTHMGKLSEGMLIAPDQF
jgi:hypothetical protein